MSLLSMEVVFSGHVSKDEGNLLENTLSISFSFHHLHQVNKDINLSLGNVNHYPLVNSLSSFIKQILN